MLRLSYHPSDIFKAENLEKKSVVKKILTVQSERNCQVKRNQTL